MKTLVDMTAPSWRCRRCGFCGTSADEIGMGRCPCGNVLDTLDELCVDPGLARVVAAWPAVPIEIRAVILELLPRECVP